MFKQDPLSPVRCVVLCRMCCRCASVAPHARSEAPQIHALIDLSGAGHTCATMASPAWASSLRVRSGFACMPPHAAVCNG